MTGVCLTCPVWVSLICVGVLLSLKPLIHRLSKPVKDSMAMRVAASVVGGVLILASWGHAFVVEAVVAVVAAAALGWAPVRRQRLCGQVFRAVSGLWVVYLNPFWRVRMLSSLPKRRPSRTILMCNHLSNSDPFFICTAIFPIEAKWISKGSLFKVPFGGWCMSLAGDIPIHFTKEKDGWGTKKGSVAQMMEHCAALLQQEQPVIVFPEGVRAKDPVAPLQEFKDGFFQLAIKEKADILPLAISGSRSAWPGDELLGVGTAYVSVGEYVRASDHPTLEQLKEAVRAQITALRDAHPDMVALQKAK